MAKNKVRTMSADDEKWQTESDYRAFCTVCEVEEDPDRLQRLEDYTKTRLGEPKKVAMKVMDAKAEESGSDKDEDD